MEHAGSLVSLAGAYYCSQRYVDAADAYSKSLAVFEMIDDTDKVVKCLINLANLYELQVKGRKQGCKADWLEAVIGMFTSGVDVCIADEMLRVCKLHALLCKL
jgi:hypothetical protein